MYLDNLQNPIEFQGHVLKVKVTWVFFCFCVSITLRLPADSTYSREQGLIILLGFIIYLWQL